MLNKSEGFCNYLFSWSKKWLRLAHDKIDYTVAFLMHYNDFSVRRLSNLNESIFLMQLKLISTQLALTGLIASLLSCSKDEPAINSSPVIAYKSVQKFTLGMSASQPKRDSVITTISFGDGNGDLGENLRDTARLNQVFSNQRWGNYEIRTFQLVNNTFAEITTAASAKLFVGLGGSGSLPQSGTLDYRQIFFYQGNYRLVPVKFRIRMRDRELNESNVIETDTVSIPVSQ